MGGRGFFDEIVRNGAQVVSPKHVLWVDQDRPQPSTGPIPFSPDGSFDAPFTTIQAAIDATGIPSDPTDVFPYTILVASGVYDEDLVIPGYRSINLVAMGGVILGIPSAGPPTSIRNISQDLSGGPPGVDITLGIGGTPGRGTWLITGSVIISGTDDGRSVDVILEDEVNVQGWAGPALDASGFVGSGAPGQVTLMGDNFILFSQDVGDAGVPCVLGPSGPPASPLNTVMIIGRCTNARFESKGASTPTAIVAGSYQYLAHCQIDGDVTFINDTSGIFDSSLGLVGWFGCGWGGGSSFTGLAAGDFHLDGTTNFFFKTAGGALLGGSTKLILDDLAP
jgi:hypothetical protein